MLRVWSALAECEPPGCSATQRHAHKLARAHPPAAVLQSERSSVISEAAFGGCRATTAGVRPSFWRHSSETILRRVTVLYSGLTLKHPSGQIRAKSVIKENVSLIWTVQDLATFPKFGTHTHTHTRTHAHTHTHTHTHTNTNTNTNTHTHTHTHMLVFMVYGDFP